MKFLFFIAKFFIALILWTAIGQIPMKGESLENRYHKGVNSSHFQKYFWTIATPITWTKEKVEKLVESRRGKSLAR